MDSYDLYLSEMHERIEVDRETRLSVLDAASAIEWELMATVVYYLAGDDARKQRVIERQIGSWGGSNSMKRLIRCALEEHGALADEDEVNLAALSELIELRNLIAHGRVETWEANHPEMKDGRLGRAISKRSRSGDLSWEWIDLDEASQMARTARAAVAAIGRRVADLPREP